MAPLHLSGKIRNYEFTYVGNNGLSFKDDREKIHAFSLTLGLHHTHKD